MPKSTSGIRGGLTDYGDPLFAAYLRSSFAKSMGYSRSMLERPVIGITWTASGFNNCHRGVPELVEAAKRGVLAAGGLPLDFPVISLGEAFVAPTTMMFRNLMAIDVEEMIRAQPMDGVVLVGGCDKTLPALVMGAASAGKPAIVLATGPMMASRNRGERLGACTDCRRFWGKYRAGEIDDREIDKIEGSLATTEGTCAVMGTASSMAIILEVMGLMLPGTAAIPAVHADRLRAAEATGMAIMDIAGAGRTIRDFVTQATIDNGLKALLAIGGSTNAIVHLAAIAGRLGLKFDLRALNQASDSTPVLVDLKPTGRGYMEDFFYAGGVGALLKHLGPMLDMSAGTVTGGKLGDFLPPEDDWIDRQVIRAVTEPIRDVGGLIALFGSLAPNGAVLKRGAASEALFEKTARALVFDNITDLARRIDDPTLEVDADDALVLKNAGPQAAGMPEAGYLPIPAKLARQGVKDMLRISDARMSGTSYGACILHVAPESFVGGPLAFVQTGDEIEVDVAARRIHLHVSDDVLAWRRAAWTHPAPRYPRGYGALYSEHIGQADEGCDFDFLKAGAPTPEPEIH